MRRMFYEAEGVSPLIWHDSTEFHVEFYDRETNFCWFISSLDYIHCEKAYANLAVHTFPFIIVLNIHF